MAQVSIYFTRLQYYTVKVDLADLAKKSGHSVPTLQRILLDDSSKYFDGAALYVEDHTLPENWEESDRTQFEVGEIELLDYEESEGP